MKAVIQRVKNSHVEIENKVVGKIQKGLITLLGIERGDTQEQLVLLIEKIVNLRIFPDDKGKMNLSLLDIGGEHLIVSQFTLLADCSKGRRPHFLNAEDPLIAKNMYEEALRLSSQFVKTESGQFAAEMNVYIQNDGPVTIILQI